MNSKEVEYLVKQVESLTSFRYQATASGPIRKVVYVADVVAVLRASAMQEEKGN